MFLFVFNRNVVYWGKGELAGKTGICFFWERLGLLFLFPITEQYSLILISLFSIFQMRVNEYENTYDAPWEKVTSAFWKKYCNLL